MEVKTEFGSLKRWEKGGVSTISANPKHYVFSNVFEVASKFRPYERVAALRHRGYSPRRSILLVWENTNGTLPQRYASGEFKPYPVEF